MAHHARSFLLAVRLVCLGLRPLLPHTHQSSLAPLLPQRSVCSLLTRRHLALLHLAQAVLQAHTSVDRHAERDALDGALGVLQPILVGVELLVLAALSREEDQSGLVGLQTGDIEGE